MLGYTSKQIILPKTGQITSYRTGDDGNIQAGAKFSPRFELIATNLVIDWHTMLMWVSDHTLITSPAFNAVMTWDDAIDNCLSLDYGGFADWRLPNFIELVSITCYDADLSAPYTYKTYFPNTKADGNQYWSATSVPTSLNIWTMDFISTLPTSRGAPATIWARPVRSLIT